MHNPLLGSNLPPTLSGVNTLYAISKHLYARAKNCPSVEHARVIEHEAELIFELAELQDRAINDGCTTSSWNKHRKDSMAFRGKKHIEVVK